MLKAISEYFEEEDVGTVGTDIFCGMMPDQPDNCVALFEYAGSPPDLHWPGEYPGLQVRVRNTSYPAGRAKIGEVMDLLHGLYEKELGGTRYLLVKARGAPEVLKRDGSNRIEFFVNFEIIKERD
ncbi:MAG: minor capsid protein [bacterium]